MRAFTNAMNAADAAKARFFAEKDRQFRELQRSGEWPSKTCPECQARHGGCCKSYNHHIGDNCLHCGNDERHIRTR